MDKTKKLIQVSEDNWGKLTAFKLEFRAKDYNQLITAFIELVDRVNMSSKIRGYNEREY